MATSKSEYAIRRLPREVTMDVKVHLTREMRLRLWLAARLLRLAASILGCEIRFSEDTTGER